MRKSTLQLHSLSRTYKQGYVLILVMVMMVAFVTLSVSIGQVASSRYIKAKQDVVVVNTIYSAEAGISDSIKEIKTDDSFPGFSTEKVLYSDFAKGKASYTTTVESPDDDTRVVTSTGKYYRSPTDSAPANTKKVQTTFHNTAPTEESQTTAYNIFAGPAGLSVSDNSSIRDQSVGYGDIYVKGKLSKDASSNVALSSVATNSDNRSNIYVGNVACTSSANTYPIRCPGSQEPITYTGTIQGAVCANDQVKKVGMQNTGLVNSCLPPNMDSPTFDKTQYTNSMNQNSIPSSLTCPFIFQSATWNANTTFTGDMNIGAGSTDCDVRINGNVYIKGNLTLGRRATIDVSDSLRANFPTVVVDGSITIDGGAVTRNTTSSGVRFISFASSDTLCSRSPTCNTVLRDNALKAYAATTTINCQNGCDTQGSMLWSYNGTVRIDNSSAGIVQGQGVKLSNNADVGRLWSPTNGPTGLFNSGLAFPYATFSTSPVVNKIWTLFDYRQIY